MFALPPKADIRQRIQYVCFVPLADQLLTSRYAPPQEQPLGLSAKFLWVHDSLVRPFLGVSTQSHGAAAINIDRGCCSRVGLVRQTY